MEEVILNTAINKLNELNTVQGIVLEKEIRVGDRNVDAQVLLQHNGYKQKYNVVVKTKIVPAQIANLRDQMGEVDPYILIAEYITPQAKEILRKNNIPYLDTAGNIYLDDKGMFIYIETNKTNRQKLTIGNRAFNKTGLKVIFQFLVNPDYLNKPYRFIGDQAKVTIDTVSRVIQELLRNKYIVRTNEKEYQFTERTKLFQEWVAAFNNNLRPKLKQNRYRFIKDKNWKKTRLPDKTYWGGAFAAEKMTEYLIADKGIIYTALPFNELMKAIKIIPDPNGTIKVIETFWKEYQDKNIVHPMVVYADLINELDPRYLDTANKIYKEYVETEL